jgi:diadenosine tetraphosphate (Ap4A) HIT family hydrolase
VDQSSRTPKRGLERDRSYEPTCVSCRQNAGEADVPGGVVYRDDLWLVRHSPPPYGLAGWMVIQPIRHVAHPGDFTDHEAAHFGPFLRHCLRTLQRVSGAEKMYVAAMGESIPHVHVHLVPRYATMPLGLKAWSVFDVHRLAAKREIVVDPQDVVRLVVGYRAALAQDSPPPTAPAAAPGAR